MERREFLKAAAAGAAILAFPDGLRSALSGLSGEQVEGRIKEVLPRLTLEEKVELMSGQLGKMLERVFRGGQRHGYTGYTTGNARLGIPQIKCLDGPRGVGFFYKTTCFPVSMCRGATWDVELEQRVGETMGYETRALGGNMLLEPCINVLWHPRWGRAQESYGEDPRLLGALGAANVTGLQKHVMACVKHYAVNNIEDTRMFVNAKVDERTLRETFLPHFRECVEAKAASVMSAYNDVNGYLCAHNKHLLRDILKGEWGFDGFVVSDWINAVEDTVEAALAGLDLEMPRAEHYGKKLAAAVKDGRVPESVVDEAVARMLRQLFRFVGPDFEAGYDEHKIAGPEHARLAREVAEKGIVLLKNEKNTLPLERGKLKTLAVLGELAETANLGDHGSSRVTPPYSVSALAGLREKLGSEVQILYDKGTNPRRAGQTAARAEAALVFAGLTFKDEGEGHDRSDLALSDKQVSLIQAVTGANPRSAVILFGGAAITMSPWEERTPAVLMAWYPGMEGGRAIADLLTGEINPSGKLPIVFPRAESDLPPFDNKSKEVVYGRWHGYRWLEKQGRAPLFAFGFGLSYSRYKYENLRVTKSAGKSGQVEVQVAVSNVGDRPGEEVVQVYVGYAGSRVDRPVKELKAFTRVSLKPGETKTVSFLLHPRNLAYYNVDQARWEVEEMEYELLVGGSSRPEDLLRDTFRVSGE